MYAGYAKARNVPFAQWPEHGFRRPVNYDFVVRQSGFINTGAWLRVWTDVQRCTTAPCAIRRFTVASTSAATSTAVAVSLATAACAHAARAFAARALAARALAVF